MHPLPETDALSTEAFAERSALGQPFVMRGLASDWPVVRAGQESAQAALGLLASLDSGAPADVMLAPPEIAGRFFYGPDFQGFNFGVPIRFARPLLAREF